MTLNLNKNAKILAICYLLIFLLEFIKDCILIATRSYCVKIASGFYIILLHLKKNEAECVGNTCWIYNFIVVV